MSISHSIEQEIVFLWTGAPFFKCAGSSRLFRHFRFWTSSVVQAYLCILSEQELSTYSRVKLTFSHGDHLPSLNTLKKKTSRHAQHQKIKLPPPGRHTFFWNDSVLAISSETWMCEIKMLRSFCVASGEALAKSAGFLFLNPSCRRVTLRYLIPQELFLRSRKPAWYFFRDGRCPSTRH